jgi:putative spermidine/putrescine transport system ATP-binding protein
MVFQNYALFPHMTVEQNVAYPLTVRGLSQAAQREKVATALGMVEMAKLGSRYPSQLSGGQQQRVALARALVFEPQLVLMDEPLGALDKQLREHMQLELKELHRRLGVTFVYVTHDQSEALAMSDRVAVFNDGRIQQIDKVDRLYETPANRFVAGFVGDSTVLQGVVTGVSDTGCTVGLPNGSRVQGVNVNGASPGENVVCCIRPERIELTGVLNQANTFEATVADVIYFGDHLRLRCTVAGQSDAMVKMPLGRHDVPAMGETVFLYAAEEYLRVYR